LARKPVFVVTGPSGAGKGTLVKALLERFDQLEHTVSATTRERRPGEEHGREYWFLSPDEFEARVAAGDFLEHVEFAGNRYGTLRSELDRITDRGHVPVLELEIEGARNVRDQIPGAVPVFVTAPLDELEARLRERATENSGEIGERLAIARRQLAQAGEFEHVVANDDLARAVEELAAIVGRRLGAGSIPADDPSPNRQAAQPR
jgi:guanylate kinase